RRNATTDTVAFTQNCLSLESMRCPIPPPGNAGPYRRTRATQRSGERFCTPRRVLGRSFRVQGLGRPACRAARPRPCSAEIGFVLPKSAFARFRPSGYGGQARLRALGYGGQALRASADKAAQPGGGRDGGPGVAAPPRGGRKLQAVECPDRELAARQRA